MFVLTVVLAMLFGKYIAKVCARDKTPLDPVFNPIEEFFFRVSGIDVRSEMNWKQHMAALLTINFFRFLTGTSVLMSQGWPPLNPDGNPSQSADLAFKTIISCG